MTSDWIGLTFFLVLIAVALIGLKLLSKTRTSTEQQFEQRAAEGSSMISAAVEAVAGMLNPSTAKGKEAVVEVKRGDYQKKREDGKLLGNKNGDK